MCYGVMVFAMEEYDAKICMTAREIRAMGIQVPERIPDVAWIYRSEFNFDLDSLQCWGDAEDTGKVHMRIKACFSGPFRWVEFKVGLS